MAKKASRDIVSRNKTLKPIAERRGGIKVIKRIPTHCGDDTCSSCVIVGDFIFLAHHAGGFKSNDIVYQMGVSFESLKRTLESVESSLDDMVQINLYIKSIKEFRPARDVFYKYFKNRFPADFIDSSRLCMLDGITYKAGVSK